MSTQSTEALISPNSPKLKNTTPSMSHLGIKKNWILIDLSGVVLGRASSFIAHRLMGKHRPDYTPHVDCGDCVVVVNADKVVLTGKKETDKIYYHHTGYPGGIKSVAVKAMRSEKPEKIVVKAVTRMLGRGPLAYKIIGNLHVFAGQDHKHIAQCPSVIDFAGLNRKNKKS